MKTGMPMEYAEYFLIKELYHCTPLELDEQDYDKVSLHLMIHASEMEEARLQQLRAQQKQS